MESKNKATAIYTHEQIEQLCQDLSNKVAPLYQSQGKQMDFAKTTPANYVVLMEAINDGRVPYAIKCEWLRDLFMVHRKKQHSTSIQKIHIEACCLYLGAANEAAYWETMDSKKHTYLGKYKVYWKGTTDNNPHKPPIYEYDLELTKHNTVFTPVTDKNSEIYAGAPASIHAGNVYLELIHPNQSEKFFMIFHIGISGSDLNTLSALLLCVDNTPCPCSLPVLLVKHNTTLCQDFIHEYFRRYDTNGLLKGKRVSRLKKMLDDLYMKQLDLQRLSGLQGTWILYIQPKGMLVEQIKLQIHSNNQVSCESSLNTYKNGTLELLGGNVKIELRTPISYAAIMLQVGTIMKLVNIPEPIKARYLSSGRLQPESGTIVMVRTQVPFEELPVPYFIKADTTQYNDLKEKGIIAMLDECAS
jgi:hypothetical protein